MKVIAGIYEEKNYKITIHFECVLTPEQIFPNQPHNMLSSVEDVVEIIDKYESITDFIKDWNLEEELDQGDFVVTVCPIRGKQ